MNFGATINSLRKSKNVTQEEMAAELGVTAAAVSKWENGYTLPDILMLCAIADYFQVTTDELLGRSKQRRYAMIATDLPEMQTDIKKLIESYGFLVKEICPTLQAAREAILKDSSVSHLFASFRNPLPEDELNEKPIGVRYIECHSDDVTFLLDGFKIYLQNMVAYDALAEEKERKGKCGCQLFSAD